MDEIKGINKKLDGVEASVSEIQVATIRQEKIIALIEQKMDYKPDESVVDKKITEHKRDCREEHTANVLLLPKRDKETTQDDLSLIHI